MPGGAAARRAPAVAPGADPAATAADAASAPAAPSAPAPSDAATTPPSDHGVDSYALTGTALALRGSPYRNGGGDPSGFDCSGFTQYVFAQYGIALPRDVRAQYRAGKSIRPEELAAGDIVFFTTTEPGPSHVAIAIGGDEFVHAPSSAGVVRVEHLSSSYWSPRFLGARRVAN
jgi:cell wall-associated NlpC family hydrolase